jgi:hypothetical protein
MIWQSWVSAARLLNHHAYLVDVWLMEFTFFGFYLESLALRFLLSLDVVTNLQVGLVLDMGMEEELIQRHLQVADATRATLGLPVLEYTITDAPLQVSSLEIGTNYKLWS